VWLYFMCYRFWEFTQICFLRCFPNKPGCEAFSGEPSLNSHDAVDSHAPVACHSSIGDPVVESSPINFPTSSSSSEPPSLPQPRPPFPMASGSSKIISPGFLPNGVPSQNFIEPPTPTRPSATRTPRSPLEARNTFKPNLEYPRPHQSSPSSHGQPIPAIQGADVFSDTLETENENQNHALSSTTTTFAPPTFQYSFYNQSSQPASKSDAKFHDKVAPSQIPSCVLTKSQKLELGMKLESGQQDRNGMFWRLTFSPSGPGSRLEYVCDNPHSPNCRHSTSQSGDMNRHQERSTHLPPESNTLTCSLCGDKLRGIRSDAMKRHQRLQKCRTKRVQGAGKAALFGLDVPSTSNSQVGEKRGWADMAGDEDEYPAKVFKYGNTNPFSSQPIYLNFQA
jgi:hypothetical protein